MRKQHWPKDAPPARKNVWVVGGDGNKVLALFQRMAHQGVMTSRWWSGRERDNRRGDAVYSTRAANPDAIVVLVSWCSHAAYQRAKSMAADGDVLLVLVSAADGVTNMLDKLGLEPLATSDNKENDMSKKSNKRRQWTAGETLAILRMRADGQPWAQIGGKLGVRADSLKARINSSKSKHQGLHARLEAFVAQGGAVEMTMTRWARQQSAGRPEAGAAPETVAAKGAKVPKPVVIPVEPARQMVDLTRIDEALAMAAEQEERAVKAEEDVRRHRNIDVQRLNRIYALEGYIEELKAQSALANGHAKHAVAFGWHIAGSGVPLDMAHAMMACGADSLEDAARVLRAMEGESAP